MSTDAHPNLVSNVRKIAILRANGIGDFVFSLPALWALRSAYPGVEITLLGLGWHKTFLSGRPGPIDRVVVVPASKGIREENGIREDLTDLERFFKKMAEEDFDIAIQMHGGGINSNPFLHRLGAKLTVGLKSADAPPLDRWIPYIYFQPEVLRYLEVVSLIGAITGEIEPRLIVTEGDLIESYTAVPEARRPLVALHPGAGDRRRRWPVEKFAAVGDALAAAGAHVVVTGTKGEQDVVEGVIDAMQSEAQGLHEHLSLGGLAGLLSRCRVVVSNDSGPLHLAAAVGAATVGIFWCGNLINSDLLTRSRHRPFASWRLACPVCGANCIEAECDHLVSYVADVPTDQVTNAALDLLAISRNGSGIRLTGAAARVLP